MSCLSSWTNYRRKQFGRALHNWICVYDSSIPLPFNSFRPFVLVISLLVPFTSPVWSSRFYQAATWALANDSSFAWRGWSCANPLCCCWTRQLPPSTPAPRRRLGLWLDEKDWTEFSTKLWYFIILLCFAPATQASISFVPWKLAVDLCPDFI